jgi:hypothetical protein
VALTDIRKGLGVTHTLKGRDQKQGEDPAEDPDFLAVQGTLLSIGDPENGRFSDSN